MDEIYLTILFALLVVIVTFLLSRKLRRPTNVVLLAGLSGSGKTALFTRIIFNKPKKCVTSLKENEAYIKEFNLRLIDIPGNERLRGRYWDQYRSEARHVVFVLDSGSFEEKLRDLSEYLYELLSDSIIYKSKIKFTIACHKQDIGGSLRKYPIEASLDKELTAIRATKSCQIGKASDEEEEDYLLRLSSENISLKNLNVNIIETSTYNPDSLTRMIF